LLGVASTVLRLDLGDVVDQVVDELFHTLDFSPCRILKLLFLGCQYLLGVRNESFQDPFKVVAVPRHGTFEIGDGYVEQVGHIVEDGDRPL